MPEDVSTYFQDRFRELTGMENLTDEELYHKIYPLYFDDDCNVVGFCFRGHVELEQWRRVAADYLKTEYDIEPNKYTTYKKGWYKVLPNRTMKLMRKPVKGAFPVMECIHD